MAVNTFEAFKDKKSALVLIFLLIALMGLSVSANAQESNRITRQMRAVDAVTLKADDIEVSLWGVKPAGSNLPETLAMDFLDDTIDGNPVTCKVEGRVAGRYIGRCTVAPNIDLGLELLHNGMAVRDRRTLYGTSFSDVYAQAEDIARNGKRGVWRYISGDNAGSSGNGGLLGNPVLQTGLMIAPIFGLLILSVVFWFWLQRLSRQQAHDSEETRRRENFLQLRERNVLLSMLEAEIIDNKNKIDAFLVIYGDTLRGLNDPSEEKKYQQGGDIIQRHPFYSRAIFDANVSKLSLLGMVLAGRLSKLYASLPRDQEYLTIEQTMPLETVVKLVETVLKNAEDMLPALDTALADIQAAQRSGDAE